jgi:hypothetical protein
MASHFRRVSFQFVHRVHSRTGCLISSVSLAFAAVAKFMLLGRMSSVFCVGRMVEQPRKMSMGGIMARM